MKLQTPRDWYRRERVPAPVTRALLWPLSRVWARATARRLARGPRLDVGAPVIVVGNLTMGGAGKTPVARAILSALRDKGLRPCALSRGYGGSRPGPLMVDPLTDTAAEVGDEPLMLAGDGPVAVGRDRAAAARLAVSQGADVIVMDDGHQNPSLRPALSLIVVDGETRDGEWPFGDGAVFPAGPMREPLAAGLSRADAVVIVLPEGLDRPDPELLTLFGDLPVLVVRIVPAAPLPEGPLVGFAGVAKPWKVERALKRAGADLKDFAHYPDHAPLHPSDLAFLRDRATLFQARLVTTEKDYARLSPAAREGIAVFAIRAEFEDEAALSALLGRIIPA